MLPLLAILSLVVFGTARATGQSCATYGTGEHPNSVAVGDFNGDGKQDLAVAHEAGVSILLGSPNGDGTFQAAVDYEAGSGPVSVAVGDFNGDSKPDLAVANINIFSNNVSILLGNGDGTFQAALNYGAGLNPDSVAVGDFNGDGKQDLAVANRANDDVSMTLLILLGNGDGSFQPAVTYGAGLRPEEVAVGDFNGDGKQDLAVVGGGGFQNVWILLGNGDGSFQAGMIYDAGTFPQSVAVGDFNGDSKPDLAVANYSSNDVAILLGSPSGDGTFQTAVNYGAGSGPVSVAVGDFNGDSRPDLAVANVDSGNVSILLGSPNGDGTFQAAVNYGPTSRPEAVAVGDFNGDGKPDLAVANWGLGSRSVWVLLGNGDGTFPPPTATVSGTAAICKGAATTIQAALTGTGPWNLTWSDGFTQSAVAASPATRSVAPNATTTYTITAVSDANCTGSGSGSAVISVESRPKATVSGDATICAGASTLIQAALTGTAPWNLIWSDGFAQTVSASPATRTVSPTSQTTYSVTSISDPACSGTSSGTATIKVNSLPSSVIAAPAAVCANSTGNTASLPNAGSGATYSWSITNGTITSGADTRTIKFTAGPSGFVDLTAVVTKAGCSSTGLASLPINPVPSATITAPGSVCRNSTGNIASVPAAGSGATYAWTIKNGAITSGAGTNSITFSTGSKHVTLNVTVTSATGCSPSSLAVVPLNTGC